MHCFCKVDNIEKLKKFISYDTFNWCIDDHVKSNILGNRKFSSYMCYSIMYFSISYAIWRRISPKFYVVTPEWPGFVFELLNKIGIFDCIITKVHRIIKYFGIQMFVNLLRFNMMTIFVPNYFWNDPITLILNKGIRNETIWKSRFGRFLDSH